MREAPAVKTSFVKASAADIPALRRLADEIWRDHYPGIITIQQIEYMLDRMYDAPVIERELNAGTVYELITDGGARVGFFSYTHCRESNTVTVHKLYLALGRHGRGIGQAALRHIVEAARSAGAAKISLFVNKNNKKAIASYRRAGFVTAESVITDIGNGFVMDDYRMEMKL